MDSHLNLCFPNRKLKLRYRKNRHPSLQAPFSDKKLSEIRRIIKKAIIGFYRLSLIHRIYSIWLIIYRKPPLCRSAPIISIISTVSTQIPDKYYQKQLLLFSVPDPAFHSGCPGSLQAVPKVFPGSRKFLRESGTLCSM